MDSDDDMLEMFDETTDTALAVIPAAPLAELAPAVVPAARAARRRPSRSEVEWSAPGDRSHWERVALAAHMCLGRTADQPRL